MCDLVCVMRNNVAWRRRFGWFGWGTESEVWCLGLAGVFVVFGFGRLGCSGVVGGLWALSVLGSDLLGGGWFRVVGHTFPVLGSGMNFVDFRFVWVIPS